MTLLVTLRADHDRMFCWMWDAKCGSILGVKKGRDSQPADSLSPLRAFRSTAGSEHSSATRQE